MIVLGAHRKRLPLQTQLHRDRQRLAQLGNAFFCGDIERRPDLVVDQLHHAEQLARFFIDDRCHQHLPRTVAGFLIDQLEKMHIRAVSLQLGFIVDVGNVYPLAVQCHIAGNTLFVDRQPDVLERAEPGLDLGNDNPRLLAHRINGQPVGLKQVTDRLADLKHDFVEIMSGVDPVGHRLQRTGEFELPADILRIGGHGERHVHGCIRENEWIRIPAPGRIPASTSYIAAPPGALATWSDRLRLA